MRSQLSHFLFLWMDQFFRLSEDHFTFHLQYKHSATFANHKLSMKHCLTPKFWKMWNTILVTLLKKRLHYSQSSHENATPFSDPSTLAPYKEVPAPPPSLHWHQKLPQLIVAETKMNTFGTETSICDMSRKWPTSIFS